MSHNFFGIVSSQVVSRKNFNVVVEGNIGSGKSTLLKYFENDTEIQVFPEPVQKWCNFDGVNLLQLMYEDPANWLYPFQSYAMLTLMQNHTQPSDKKIKMLERSLFSSRNVFVELMKSREGVIHPSLIKVLEAWYEFIFQTYQVDVDVIIYLRTSPEISLRRMMKRGRMGERVVELAYLEKVHQLHENWLLNNPSCLVLTIDGDLEEDRIIEEYERVRKEIFDLAESMNNENN